EPEGSMRPEPEVSVARSIVEMLEERATLEVPDIDRMYLNVCQPMRQTEDGIAYFFRQSTATCSPPRHWRHRGCGARTVFLKFCSVSLTTSTSSTHSPNVASVSRPSTTAGCE